MQFSSSEVVEYSSCSWDVQTSSTTGTFLQSFQKLPQNVGTESYSTCLIRNVCKTVSPRPTVLFCRFRWNDSARTPFLLLPVLLRLPSPNCFLRFCLPTLFTAVLNYFLPLTTSASSGTANSNNSAPTRFAAGLNFTQKWKLQFSQ